jgi:hypothetical protein
VFDGRVIRDRRRSRMKWMGVLARGLGLTVSGSSPTIERALTHITHAP